MISRRKKLRRHRAARRRAPKNSCIVYVLKETAESAPVYVGQTRLLIEERLRWHIKDMQRGKKAPVAAWLRNLPAPPVIEALDLNGIWDLSEAVWIDRLRAQGYRLLNVNSVVPMGVYPRAEDQLLTP